MHEMGVKPTDRRRQFCGQNAGLTEAAHAVAGPVAVQIGAPVSPARTRITPRCQSSSHAKLATTSGVSSPVTLATTGALMPCRQSAASAALVTLHSTTGSNAPNTGVVSQVTGMNWGRHRPRVGSQN